MKKQGKVLVVDDDPSMRSLLAFHLENAGHRVTMFESGEEVLELINTSFDFDLVVLDMFLADMSGAEVLAEIKKNFASCQVVIITAYPSLKMGVEAIKKGAYDFVVKPFDMDQLVKVVYNALEASFLKEEVGVLRQTLKTPIGFSDLIGKSEPMNRVRQMIRQAADSRATVLIMGSSGTGKEIVAQTIHKNSLLHQSPFVVVNCGAIPENLIESELFGYEKGAFTGAIQKNQGKFVAANNGTIFLDEIGELSLPAQVKLLRVLQEKEITPVGGTAPVKLNIRVIAATNKTLTHAVEAGTFREDLYYRLALFVINLPDLDERGQDKLLLADFFLKRAVALESCPEKTVSDKARDLILNSPWPGNVRQLDNCIYRTVLMNKDKRVIEEDDIRLLSPENEHPETEHTSTELILPLSELESKAIRNALKINEGNIKTTYQKLGISRATLYRKMKEYDIEI